MDTSNYAAFDARPPRADVSGPLAAHADGGHSFLADAEGARAALDAIARVQRQIVAAGAARVHADEAARRRLARELHDSVGAELAATRFALANVQTWLPADASPQCTQAFELVVRSLDAAAEAVRHVLDGLHAPELDEGLATALANWTRGFGARTGLAATFSARPSVEHGGKGFSADDAQRLEHLPAEAALAIFRVAQEALTNVARHAHASRVEVRLACTPYALVLSVIDDGVGLSREAARRAKKQNGQRDEVTQPSSQDGINRRGAYGIAGMRERCAAFGGALRATANPLAADAAPAARERPGTTVEARFFWDTLLSRTPGADLAPNAPNLVKGIHS
ncbi:sensor histidine kinase [Paraburkholderia bannensis]|uniref:sensor histidine kinase n=1 Tax=Paraburkholderia bannensis TaxID=765414 RepID=UPI002AB7ACC7|nr:ATP-binding protein [Paraburkholderia bannensis]